MYEQNSVNFSLLVAVGLGLTIVSTVGLTE